MNKEEVRRKIIAQKKAALEHQKAELERKAAVFKQLPGKILKIVAILVTVLSTLLIVDGFLDPSYKIYEIHDAEYEYYDVMSRDGYGIHAKYFHVYLDDDRNFEVFIYMYEYYLAKYKNEVDIGSSPIFGVPKRFRVGFDDFIIDKPLEFNVGLYRGLPIFFLLMSVTFLLMNYQHNSQTLAFGHLNFVVQPVAFIILAYFLISGFMPSGQYTMDISELQPKNRERIDEVKALTGIDLDEE